MLRGEKGDYDSDLIREVTRYYATDVSALAAEVQGILMWDRNQYIVSVSRSEEVLVIYNLKF